MAQLMLAAAKYSYRGSLYVCMYVSVMRIHNGFVCVVCSDSVMFQNFHHIDGRLQELAFRAMRRDAYTILFRNFFSGGCR